MSISPTTISAEDFSNPDKGVSVTVTGLAAGQEYVFVFTHTDGKTQPYEVTKVANDKGVAFAGVATGAGSKPQAGKYQVKVSGADLDKPLIGTFTVLPAKASEPTTEPTTEPTSKPSAAPTTEPTEESNAEPTEEPTAEPTDAQTTTGGSAQTPYDPQANDGQQPERRPAEERQPRHGTSAPSSESSNGELPRTGSDLTGLALGVGLIVLGGAAVVVTRRRAQADGTF